MLAVSDNLAQCFRALHGHKLRASLTILGLTMGVATLITVMTIVQGANLYVEQKIANLGTNVFQIARTPFAKDAPLARKWAPAPVPAFGHARATKSCKMLASMAKRQAWRILTRAPS